MEYGLVRDEYFNQSRVNTHMRVGDFLCDLSLSERASANKLAEQLYESSDVDLNDTTVLIPIAAHQEARNIANAIDQYAGQTNLERPFSILLHPNIPAEIPMALGQDTMHEIDKAKDRHPELDIRSTELTQYHDANIGTIRRSLWNAALLMARFDEMLLDDHDVTGLNHDIDVMKLGHHYIGNVQRVMDRVYANNLVANRLGYRKAINGVFSTKVKHGYDPNLPNASMAAFWYDFSYYQMRKYCAYDAGLVIPFSQYAKTGGILAGKETYEMQKLQEVRNMLIPRTVLETSPRRYAERLKVEQDFGKIWAAGFSENDPCREPGLTDITREQLRQTIDVSIYQTLEHFSDSVTMKAVEDYNYDMDHGIEYNPDFYQAEISKNMEYKIHLAETVLRRVVKLPDMADFVKNTFSVKREVMASMAQLEAYHAANRLKKSSDNL